MQKVDQICVIFYLDASMLGTLQLFSRLQLADLIPIVAH